MTVPESLRTRFQEELRGLEEQTLGALDMVVGTLNRVMESLHHQDIELAGLVIMDDDRVDGRYMEVHQGILSLLARQAPVASDLRLVAALLHVIRHAERIGDQCVNIAKVLPLTGTQPPVQQELLERVEEMGRCAASQVTQSKVAFETRDVALANDLVRQDARINQLNRECFQLVVDLGAEAD
ncbi:MAG: PhoU family transcriptional regulator, partial [Actinomycetota bacterium]|nr:PhoU family transcriptional regulator [Actinomycetota bacterium]